MPHQEKYDAIFASAYEAGTNGDPMPRDCKPNSYEACLEKTGHLMGSDAARIKKEHEETGKTMTEEEGSQAGAYELPRLDAIVWAKGRRIYLIEGYTDAGRYGWHKGTGFLAVPGDIDAQRAGASEKIWSSRTVAVVTKSLGL